MYLCFLPLSSHNQALWSIVIFSSLVNEEMKRKGRALGADAQLSKPEIGNLVHIVDELIQ